MNGTFVMQDPNVLWQVPLGVVVLFTLRGIGDYVPTIFRAGWADRSSRACGTMCSQHYHAPADRLFWINNSPGICCPN